MHVISIDFHFFNSFLLFLNSIFFKILLRLIRGDLTLIDLVKKYCILAKLKDHLHHHHKDGFLCISITQTAFNLDSTVQALLKDTGHGQLYLSPP